MQVNILVCARKCHQSERSTVRVPKQGGAEGARQRASAREAEDVSWWRRGGTGGGVAVAVAVGIGVAVAAASEEGATDGAGGESRKSIGDRLGMEARRPVRT